MLLSFNRYLAKSRHHRYHSAPDQPVNATFDPPQHHERIMQSSAWKFSAARTYRGMVHIIDSGLAGLAIGLLSRAALPAHLSCHPQPHLTCSVDNKIVAASKRPG
jgi:hypothetical protein